MNEPLQRSFIAIFPPEEVIRQLAIIQSGITEFAPHVKWSPSNKFHFTIEFLGDKTSGWLGKLASDLRASISQRSFPICLDRIGCFPTVHSPKVFWIGSEEDHNVDLLAFADIVKKTCIQNGLKPDEKPFYPHLTIGRAKGKISSTLIQNLETVTFKPITFTCSDIRIMKSQLASTGSLYTTLFTIPLK